MYQDEPANGFVPKGIPKYETFTKTLASAIEVQSLLYVAWDVGYFDKAEFERLYQLTDDSASLIGGFISYLRKRSPSPTKRLLD